MLNTKESAAAAGDLKYATGRPCRKGHFSPRYTSSGNCIACMDVVATQNKIKNKSRKRIFNANRAGDNTLYAAVFPLSWHPILERLQQITQGNDEQLQATIIATIRGATVAWNREAFLAAGVIFNGYHITNAHKFPIGTPFSIQIKGIWWPGAPLMACLRGEIASIEPCAYRPQVEVQS